MNIIEVRKLKKTFKTHTREEGLFNAIKSLVRREFVILKAIKEISFTIKKGEVVGFVGPNGAGKSTTIKCLTGVLHPTSGYACVLNLIPWKDRQKYVKEIGAVFGQKSQLWLDLPPIDSFKLNQSLYNIPIVKFNERLEKMSTFLNIKNVMNRPTRSLSLGERMKCEFVMALLHNPKILFLDEPTIGLDAIAKEEIREFLIEVNKEENTTIILTTHDMDDIEEICKRIIIIDEGKLIYDGNLKRLKKKYIKEKTVNLEFKKIINKKIFEKVLKKGRVIQRRKWFLSINFQINDTIKIIKKLMECVEIIDLEVKEARLEDVIKEIYKTNSL